MILDGIVKAFASTAIPALLAVTVDKRVIGSGYAIMIGCPTSSLPMPALSASPSTATTVSARSHWSLGRNCLTGRGSLSLIGQRDPVDDPQPDLRMDRSQLQLSSAAECVWRIRDHCFHRFYDIESNSIEEKRNREPRVITNHHTLKKDPGFCRNPFLCSI